MSQKTIPISVAVLKEIEAALDAPLFQGCRMGVTLNDTLIGAFDMAQRSFDVQTRCKDVLRYFYHRYVQPPFSMRGFEEVRGRVAFTWLFDRQDLKAFVTPLLDAYGPQACMVLAPAPAMRAQLPDQAGFVTWSDFPKIDMRAWRSEFVRCEPQWRQALAAVVVKHKLPKVIIGFLIDRLQVQTQRLMAAAAFLDLARPTAIVTEYDRNEHASCLLLAARQRGIASVTMLHSALNPDPCYGFVPVLADQVCCWGERHRAILAGFGADPARLAVTGCHAIEPTLAVDQVSARARVGLPPALPVVLLGTSPIRVDYKIAYCEAFCIAMASVEGARAVVRLHPAERLHEYQALADKYPNVLFLENGALTRDESLAAADVVVIHDSCFGSDALMKGKLVLILDVLDIPLGIGQEMANQAGCPVARSAPALAQEVRSLLNDVAFKEDLERKAARYASLYCASYGAGAVAKVRAVIDQAVSGP